MSDFIEYCIWEAEKLGITPQEFFEDEYQAYLWLQAHTPRHAEMMRLVEQSETIPWPDNE